LHKDARLVSSFAKNKFNGKTNCALDMLSDQGKGMVLHLSQGVDAKENVTVRDVLKSKYPFAAPIYP